MKRILNYIFILSLMLVSCKERNKPNSAFFHADAQHTGVYKTDGMKKYHGIKWMFKTSGKVISSPVIFNKTVYIGSDDSCFYAINSQNGKKQWKFRAGGRISSTAAVYRDMVYFMCFDGNFYCLDRKSGKEKWRFKTAGERVFAAPGIHGMPEKDRALDDPWDMFLSSPVVANNKVYFGCGTGIFYALNNENGKLEWQFNTGGVIHSSPAYADSSVYFGSWDSYLYALDSENGKLKWKFKTGIDTVNYNQTGFQSSPVIYKGTVYSGCRDAHVWAINASDGKLKWKFYNNGSWVINTPAIQNDTLYFATSDTHKIIALNASDGKELFNGDCKAFGFSSIAINENKIYLGNFAGSVLCCDAHTAKEIWQFRTEQAIENKDSILTSTGDFNFAKIFKSNTYQDNLLAMEKLYSIGSVLSSPALDNGMVYFGSTNGYIYALY
ncbi:MAG: PQQ-binding-like beta-propeller repeat protein [Bacteroidales bacterium]